MVVASKSRVIRIDLPGEVTAYSTCGRGRCPVHRPRVIFDVQNAKRLEVANWRCVVPCAHALPREQIDRVGDKSDRSVAEERVDPTRMQTARGDKPLAPV